MSVSSRYILQQGPVLGALARGALGALRGAAGGPPPIPPGPWLNDRLPPRDPELVRAYVRHVGGDPSSYRDTLPPHLFPQWVFPLQARALQGVPYPMQKVLNGGCRVEVLAPLPQGEPLLVATRLDDIDDDGRRAILRFLATTGTPSAPEALRVHLHAIVPLGAKSTAKKSTATKSTAKTGKPKKKAKPRVPADARELARWRLPHDAGLDFAKLTGDFNPVHWVPPYARAFGFRDVILHGFSTFARTWESLRHARRAAPRMLDARFTRPLVLPARVGVYVGEPDAAGEQPVHVGDAAGGPAYLQGRFAL